MRKHRFSKLDRKPKETWGDLYCVEPPVPLENGTEAEYVIASWGLEAVLGDLDNFSVFSSDSLGEGPSWCVEMLGASPSLDIVL